MILTTVPAPDNLYDDAFKTAFSIGGLDVSWYGLFVFFGFCAAILFAIFKLWKWYKVPVDPFYWFCLMGIPTAILGARFWSCCLGDAHWEDFFNFKTGGLAIEGGVVLTVLLACWWFPFILNKPKYQIRDITYENKPVVRRVSMFVYVDAVIPCILLGHFFGRWGNYFNQELHGAVVTNDSLAWFLHDYLPWMYVKDVGYCQPLFFYESCANLTFFLILYFGIELIPFRKCGDLGIIYFLWYGILRMCLEPLRDQKYTFYLTYVMTGLWIAGGVILFVLNHTLLPRIRKYAIWQMFKETIYYYVLKRCPPQVHEKRMQSFVRNEEQMLYYLNK